ncbi:hypothetical protein METH109765_17300 [Mesobacillus thioparans]
MTNRTEENSKKTIKSTYTPNQRFVPGESVEEHRDIEAGNIFFAEEEIKQQNENL